MNPEDESKGEAINGHRAKGRFTEAPLQRARQEVVLMSGADGWASRPYQSRAKGGRNSKTRIFPKRTHRLFMKYSVEAAMNK